MAEAGAHDSAVGVKILHIGWRGWSSLSLGPDRAGPYHDQALPPDREDHAFPQHVRAEFRRVTVSQEMRELARRRNQDSEGIIAATPTATPTPTPTVRPERVEGQVVQSRRRFSFAGLRLDRLSTSGNARSRNAAPSPVRPEEGLAPSLSKGKARLEGVDSRGDAETRRNGPKGHGGDEKGL